MPAASEICPVEEIWKAEASVPLSEYVSAAPSGSVAVTGEPMLPVVPSGTDSASVVAAAKAGGSFTFVTVSVIDTEPVMLSSSVAVTVTS